MNKQIGMIGYGRFGRVLADLLSEDFQVTVYDPNTYGMISTNRYISFADLNQPIESEVIFIAVPINVFSETIIGISKQLPLHSLVIDTCSVKVYPTHVMETQLPHHVDIIATHPLFGPDSISVNEDLKIMMHPVRDQEGHYLSWKHYFLKKKIHVLEMTPEQHDRLAAQSQTLTHFIGRALDHMNVIPTDIDTLGYKKLRSVMEQTCRDSWELFFDLEKYNPYSKQVIHTFIKTINHLEKQLLKKKKNKHGP